MFKKILTLVALSLTSLMFLTVSASGLPVGAIFKALGEIGEKIGQQIGKFGGKQVTEEIGTQGGEQAVKESGGLTEEIINGVSRVGARAGVKIGDKKSDSSTDVVIYSGEMEFNIDSNSTNLFPDISYIGDLSMEVDFDDMTFEGTAVLKRYDSSLKEFVSIGTVNFDSTPIGDNGFEGTFTLDEAVRADIGLTGNPVGNYAGNFVDLDKDEITGVMNMSGINANGAVRGFGSFSRDWQFKNGKDKGYTLEDKLILDSIFETFDKNK